MKKIGLINRREKESGMNNALKFLLIAFGCIIVIGLITLGVRITDKGKKDADRGLEKYSDAVSGYEDIDLKIYDGTTIQGSEIKRLIRDRSKDEFISIKVKNGKENTKDYIHKSTIDEKGIATIGEAVSSEVSDTPSEEHYINDAGTFEAEVLYDQNGVAACIRFNQR